MRAPQRGSGSSGPPRLEWADRLTYQAVGPYPVDLVRVPVAVYDENHQLARKGGGAGRIDSPIPDELADILRLEALLLPVDLNVQHLQQVGPGQLGPTPGTSFDSLDANDCCGGGLNVPPDSEMAAGPNHLIVVVNVAFAIYNKSGGLLAGPTTFSSFFSGTPGCTSGGVFDPNVLYDEDEKPPEWRCDPAAVVAARKQLMEWCRAVTPGRLGLLMLG